ncbi:Hint domain-containing protein [Celeribacter sp.]|uniref:Hint domain-containing protein n=1 Tax=Celeribacter sp. TaxID=1890673 RepID=UPI003A8D510B
MVTRSTTIDDLNSYQGSLLGLGQTYVVSAFSSEANATLTFNDDNGDHVIDSSELTQLDGETVDAVYSGTSTVGVDLLGIEVNLSSPAAVNVYEVDGVSYVEYVDTTQAALLDGLASQILATPALSFTLGVLGLSNATLLVAYLESNAVLTFDLTPGADFPVCFAQGTRIITRKGALRVEDLSIGDLVMTRDNGYKKIRWIGNSTVAAYGKFAPIVFRPGALGNQTELLLSPEHRVLTCGWECELLTGETETLIAAKHFVSNPLVERRPGGLITYYHVLFDQHEVVMANGVACESFFPNDMAMQALDRSSRDEVMSLFPELNPRHHKTPLAARKILRKFEAQLVVRDMSRASSR